MNPGSCSSPRGKSPKSVGIIEVIGPNINSIFYKIEETLGLVKFVPYFPDKLPF
jgi:predicted phosphodiesterase